MTDNNLQKKVAELEAQVRKLKKNNLGLVFEDKTEDVVEQSKTKVPVLKEVVKNRLDLSAGYPNNLMIEGDNYLALSVLNYTHKGKIDLIYIDPPYNTGNHDFIYNDQYVDTEDGYRHSKWLSFMNNRLRLTKDLLNDQGVIFISIDDHEQAHLRILCDKIFGESNFIGMITWFKKRKGSFLSNNFVNLTEYILVYRKTTKAALVGGKADISESQPLIKRTNTVKTLEFPAGIIRTKLNNGRYKKGSYGKGTSAVELLNDIIIKDGTIITSTKMKAPFTWSQAFLDAELENGSTIIINTNNFQPRAIRHNNESTKGFPSFLDGREFGATTESAYELLKEIFETDRPFEYSKPVRLIQRLIQSIDNPNAVILDFMAGSGTTGQATIKLNTEDGGNRRFILCTNNEDNNGSGKKIATDICYPRIKKVIKGYGDTAGIPSNLFYYKTDLVDIEQIHKVSDEAKIRITYEAGEMIAVREDALNEVEKNDWWQIFEGKGRLVAIYFKEDKTKLAELIAKLEKKNLPTALYIFSWGKNEYKGEYSTAIIRVEDIPEPIIEVYKELNR